MSYTQRKIGTLKNPYSLLLQNRYEINDIDIIMKSIMFYLKIHSELLIQFVIIIIIFGFHEKNT